MATYAVGDLQGCGDPLEKLLAATGFTPSRDRVLVLGDGTLKASLRAEQATPEALLHAALEPSSPADGVPREAR